MARPKNSELGLQEMETDVEILEPPKKKTRPLEVPDRMVLRLKDAAGRFGNSNIDGIDDVIDPNTGQTRRVRLLRGASSIWQDEQTNYPKEYVIKNRIGLAFQKDVCILEKNAEDNLRKQFALLSNSRWSNENRQGHKKLYFEIFDAELENRKELLREDRIIEAMQIATKQDFEKMKAHAHYLGISLVNDVTSENVKETELRKEYMRKAKNDPDNFIKSLGEKNVVVAYLIKKAIDNAQIDIGTRPNEILWQNGGFICKVPLGQSPVKYLEEFAMLPREESIKFVNQLQNIFGDN